MVYTLSIFFFQPLACSPDKPSTRIIPVGWGLKEKGGNMIRVICDRCLCLFVKDGEQNGMDKYRCPNCDQTLLLYKNGGNLNAKAGLQKMRKETLSNSTKF